MRLLNKAKKEVIGENAETACSFLSRTRGLMLSKPRDLVLVSPREDIASSTIHMLFMLYPIDVIWLDSEKKVVDLQRNVKPFNPLKPKTWRTYKPKKPAKYVIELGAGVMGETEVGDEISLYTDSPEALH
ncbi:MAG: DUF192 domain-containing protein [Candidatus Altiarchaeota archaeon]|nr:DUF192 domain-containing protein [Candidatus Altiarchaeota archaeon]